MTKKSKKSKPDRRHVQLQFDNDLDVFVQADHAGRQMVNITCLRETWISMTPDEATELANVLLPLANMARIRSHDKDGNPLEFYRVMRVRWRHGLYTTRDNGQPPERGSGGLDEVYSLQYETKRGRVFKKVDNVPGNGQYVPGADEIAEWFKRLGVTHVETTNDYHSDLPDGQYPVKKFIRWFRKMEDEAQ